MVFVKPTLIYNNFYIKLNLTGLKTVCRCGIKRVHIKSCKYSRLG